MAVEEFKGALDFDAPTDQQLAEQDAYLGLPPGTTYKQLMAESSMNPKAVSPAGAQGLAQIMPSTTKHWSNEIGRKLDPFNVDDALLLHRLTMQQNIKKFGTTEDALRAYNSGWNKSEWDNPETNGYLKKILGIIIPSANAQETPKVEEFKGQLDGATVQPFTGELDAAVEPFEGELDVPGTVQDFQGKLDGSRPTWTEALKETAKALYQVPLAMGSGMVGGLAGIVGGGAVSLAEQAGFADPGAALATAKRIEGAMPFQNPDSPVAQVALEGLSSIMPSNITRAVDNYIAEVTGVPFQETFGSHAMDFVTNTMLMGRKPLEALGELASKGEPLTQAKPEVVPQGPQMAPKPIVEEGAIPPGLKPEEMPVPPAPAIPEPVIDVAKATINQVDAAPLSELTLHLDNALRQVETGLVESNYKRVPIKVTNEQAAALGYDPVKILNKAFGEPLSAKEIQSVQNLSAAADAYRLEVAKREMAGDTTLSPDAMAKAVAMKNTIMDYLQMGIGENARAMRQMQEAPVSNAAMERHITSLADQFGNPTVRRKAAEAIVNAADDPALSAKIARELAQPDLASKINQIIINSYLTSPITLQVAITSQASMPFIYMADQAVGAIMGLGDRAFAKATGRPTPDVTTFGEVMANFKGLYHGSLEGIEAAKKAWKTETPSALPSEKAFGNTNAFGTGPMARAFNTPARAILTQDQFYKALSYRMTLNGVAERVAWQSGLKGKERAALAEEIRNSPTPTQLKMAEDAAKDYTFTRDLGSIGKAISNVSNSHPLVKMNLPFVKIGINLGKQLVEHSPLAMVSPRFYKDIWNGTPATRNAAVAKMLVGTAVLNEAWKLYEEGVITGSAPTDPAQRAAWLKLHPEKSIKIGDKWYQHQAAGITSDILTLGANLHETWKRYQHDRLIDDTIGTPEDHLLDEKHSQAYWGLVNALYELEINKTWFRTLTNIVSTLTAKTEGAMSRGVGHYLAGLLPASPLFGFLTRQQDPLLRRTSDNIIDPLRSRLPWETETMLPRLDPVTGEFMLKQNPLLSVPSTQDRAIEEMVRLGVQLPMVPNKFTLSDGGDAYKPEMTPEEQNFVIQFRGRNAKAIVDQMVAMPTWDALPDRTKSNLIKMAYSNFGNAAEQILLSKIAQEDRERIIREVRRSLINTTKGQKILPEQLGVK